MSSSSLPRSTLWEVHERLYYPPPPPPPAIMLVYPKSYGLRALKKTAPKRVRFIVLTSKHKPLKSRPAPALLTNYTQSAKSLKNHRY